MLAAIEQAKNAEQELETPVGAVIVRNGKIIATGRNRRETKKNALLHAEIEAINGACAFLESWRLLGCDLYVTLEPCPMCAGAAINSRIQRIYFGAYDPKNGALGSVTDLSLCAFTHKPEVYGGILEAECAGLLKSFFKALREKNKSI